VRIERNARLIWHGSIIPRYVFAKLVFSLPNGPFEAPKPHVCPPERTADAVQASRFHFKSLAFLGTPHTFLLPRAAE
jgi:hypothetical protein